MNPDRIAVTEEVTITEKKQLPLAATETSNTVSFPSPASSVCSVSGKGVWWLLVFCSLLVVVLLCPCLCLHLLSVRDSKVGGGGPRSADLVEVFLCVLVMAPLSSGGLLRVSACFGVWIRCIGVVVVFGGGGSEAKSEGNKKRKTKAASEDHVPLQVVTTKEDAKTKLAEDSSMMMERSLQVQPSVENSLLSMQDSIDSPHKGIFHILDLIAIQSQAHDKSNEAWSQFSRRISSEWDGFGVDFSNHGRGSKDVSTFGTANSGIFRELLDDKTLYYCRGMDDKAVNQLYKSVNSKLEVTVARQIQPRFQTTAKEALQDALKSSFETTVVPAFEMSCKAMFEQQHLKLGPISLAMTLRVWSLVRRFDQPRKYKAFISRCVVRGTLEI
ncbi:hypothetical protein P8452_34342 [Trifolium repens]|nr:hypothetical protein P8452_34342 [Trifolium repens]